MFSSNASQVSTAANYVEDVFSTYLYTGNGSTQTITNGIDLSTYGGLVWTKVRSTTYSHYLADTARGAVSLLSTNNTSAADTGGNLYSGFNNNGYGVTTSYGAGTNGNGQTFASWTFRKQAKFFDVVTWTGNSAAQTINHNLGSAPGVIFVKSTAASADWWVYHRSLSSGYYMVLNSTAAQTNSFAANVFGNGVTVVAPTATQFTVGPGINLTGGMVAYLFAHDAGGFGAAGTDNVISCGSFTTDGSGIATVTLGYEPQYLLVKRTNSTGDWYIWDSMRGLTMDVEASLFAQSSAAEEAFVNFVNPTATGFVTVNGLASSSTYIYIAIRRGPMKTPTSGTSVFSPNTSSATGGTKITIGFPLDAQILATRSGNNTRIINRLTGVNSLDDNTVKPYLETNNTNAETTSGISRNVNNTQFSISQDYSSVNAVYWNFRRAPGFFDVVCYTGTGVARTVSHNLGVAPELMIVKRRDAANYAPVWSQSIGNDYVLKLFDIQANSDDPKDGPTTVQFNNTAPTSSVFSVGTSSSTNGSGGTYVAYLFATCPGVSKVGSYTGTAALQTINCGFTSGARFVLIKRTDSTGDWYVWDSARGISSGNDPYLLLNSTAAEVTGTNYVDTTSVGFQVTAAAPAALNASGGSYIFLAIA